MTERTVRRPTDNERAELDRMTSQAVGRVAMRAHMIQLSARGFSAQEIAKIHDCADVTVYKWIDRFDAEGPSGLYDREREGRPRKLDEEAERELKRLLEKPPTEEGYDFSRWTAPRLSEHLKEKLDVEVHPETVREALRRLEYSWTRPRRRLPEDPHYEERLQAVVEAVGAAEADTTVLVEDETELRRFPPLRKAWQPVGEQWSVEVPEQNGKFFLYGALDVHAGETLVRTYPKGKSEHTKAFVREVLSEVEGQVLLVWDHASWHVSKAVRKLIDGFDRLDVVLLPKRAPEANPMEDLWRELKNKMAANLNRSLEVLKAACQRFFERLSPDEALKTAGLRAS